MALPVLADLKNYLRVTWTTEDAALTAILAAATGLITAYLDRPIAAASQSYVVEDRRASSLGVAVLSRDPRTGVAAIRIPDSPVSSSVAPVITDGDGNVVDATTYRVDYGSGVVRSANGCAFLRFPYTIVATTGLGVRSDYTSVVEPCISQAIIDVAADLYQRRNPAATSESDGAGGDARYGRTEEQIPIRALALIAQFQRVPL